MTSADRETERTTRDGDAHPSDDGDARATRLHRSQEACGFVPLVLQAPLEPRAEGRYQVEELLAFHDRAFVESAYAAALCREPAAGELSSTLADLRAARREKIEIVEDLIGSEEGRRARARERITGIETPGWKRRVRTLPFVGYVWQLLLSVLRLPLALRHAREAQAYALAQQQIMVDHVNTQVRALIEAQDESRRHLEALARGIEEEMRARADAAHRLADESRGLVGDAIAAISVLSDALAGLAERQSSFERRLDTQHEYLAREQQAIVEAQKAALVEIEARLADLFAPRGGARPRLSAQDTDEPDGDRDPRALVEDTRARDVERGEVA